MRSPALIQFKGRATIRRQRSQRMQELQHLAELGRLSATLLHEISNPLTNALIHLEQFGDKTSNSIQEAKRSIKLLRRYVEAARQQVRRESEVYNFSIDNQLKQIKQIVTPIAKGSGVDLHFEIDSNLHLFGDPVKFQQILANLIINAIEAYGKLPYSELKKPVKVEIRHEVDFLYIKIIDWGMGIRMMELPRVFDPFYSTKSKAGHGLGIGLAIVKDYVINDFKGLISVKSSRRHGTIFCIQLPLKEI